jgi:hypothetical protein
MSPNNVFPFQYEANINVWPRNWGHTKEHDPRVLLRTHFTAIKGRLVQRSGISSREVHLCFPASSSSKRRPAVVSRVDVESNQLHRAESVFKSQQFLNYSKSSKHFMNFSRIQYRVHNVPPLVPVLSHLHTHSHPVTLRFILILFSHVRLCLQISLFPFGFPIKILFSFLPCILHVPPISSSIYLRTWYDEYTFNLIFQYSCWNYFFDPEDGGDMFLRNVGCNSTDYTASCPRRWYSS